MTHAPALHARRLPLLAATILVLALTLALGTASPAVGFVDDAAPQQPAQDDGFRPEGEGFVDPTPDDPGAAGAHDPGHGGVAPSAPPPSAPAPSAPTGGVAAGFGGMAADGGGLGSLHAVAAGLLALVAMGLAAHRRRVPVGSA